MKNPVGLTTKVVRRAQDLSPEEWSALVPEALKGYSLFKSLDRCGFEGISFYYIVVYEGDVPVGIAPCFLMNYHLDTSVEGPLKNLTTKIKRIFPFMFNLKVLFCGSILCEGKIGIADFFKAPIIKTILKRMENIAQAEGANVLIFKDFLADHAKILDPLLKEGFYKLNSYPSVKMGVDFTSFDEYVNTLSHSSKDGLKRKLKKADKHARIELETPDNVDGLLDDMYGLYVQTFSKSNIQFRKMPKDFYKEIYRNAKDNVKYFLWRIDGKPVGFSFCLVSEEKLVNVHIGMDYPVAYEHGLYFVIFRDQFNWCIKNGIKEYHSGEFAYEAKRRLDFAFIPKFFYVKHVNRSINPFFRLMCMLLQPENFDNVLKKMKSHYLPQK